MPTLDTFRLLGMHLLGALGGIYIAAALARIIDRFWPGSRLTAFILASGFFILSEVSVAIRELRRGRLSTGNIILDFMPLLLLGAGVSLFLGKLIGRWSGSDIGGAVAFFGVYFCVLFVAACVKTVVQDRNLKEDLEQSPPAVKFGITSTLEPELSAHLSSEGGLPSYDEQAVTPAKWRILQNIAKTLLVIAVIALIIWFLSLF